MVAQYLRQDYGDRVRVDFYDLSNSANREQYAEVVESVDKHGLAYPLTAINGEFRFAGGVSYYAILNAVQSILGKPERAEAQAVTP